MNSQRPWSKLAETIRITSPEWKLLFKVELKWGHKSARICLTFYNISICRLHFVGQLIFTAQKYFSSSNWTDDTQPWWFVINGKQEKVVSWPTWYSFMTSLIHTPGLPLQMLLVSTEAIRTIRNREPRTSTWTLTQLLHSDSPITKWQHVLFLWLLIV